MIQKKVIEKDVLKVENPINPPLTTPPIKNIPQNPTQNKQFSRFNGDKLKKIKAEKKRSLQELNKKIKKGNIEIIMPKKMPKKPDLIDKYFKICATKGITPIGNKQKINRLTKSQIWDEIAKMSNGTKEDSRMISLELDGEMKKGGLIPAGTRKGVANFLYNFLHVIGFSAEKYFQANPQYGVNIEGYAYEMEKGKRNIQKNLDDVVLEYPQLATWFNPLVRLGGNLVGAGVRQHNVNSRYIKGGSKNLHSKKSVNASKRNHVPKRVIPRRLSRNEGAILTKCGQMPM